MTEQLLNRPTAAEFMRFEFGIRVTAGSLATMATRGGGPQMIKFGRHVLYRKIDLIDWVRLRCSGLLDSTSTPHNENFGGLFDIEEDLGDLPDEPEHWNTGDPLFDEITRLLDEENGFGQMTSENMN